MAKNYIGDWVQETTTTLGSGDIVLNGVTEDNASFADAIFKGQSGIHLPMVKIKNQD